jgi:hypothetical protein
MKALRTVGAHRIRGLQRAAGREGVEPALAAERRRKDQPVHHYLC